MPAIELDLENAVERMGDKELFLEIARSFAASIPGTLEALRHKLDKGDLAEARRLAHSLKSNCAAMGAESVRLQAYETEKACADNDAPRAARAFAALAPLLEGLRLFLLELR